MPRAATKADLLVSATEQFEKMWALIDSIAENNPETSFNFGDNFAKKEAHWDRDKNLRDVLIHLYEWHQLLLHWVEANQRGEAKPFLPAPYNWKTYAQMNVDFWKKHQSTPYTQAKKILLESHQAVINMIQAFSDEDLFEKKRFSWTGTSSLGAYCISATSSHYDWAMKKVKLHLKNI